MGHYLAGLIKYASDYTWFLAPYVNSYKRFMKAPLPNEDRLVDR